MPQASFARPRFRIKPSNIERAPLRPLGCWDVEAIVEPGGGCEDSAWDGGCQAKPEPSIDADGRHFTSSPLKIFRFIFLPSLLTSSGPLRSGTLLIDRAVSFGCDVAV